MCSYQILYVDNIAVDLNNIRILPFAYKIFDVRILRLMRRYNINDVLRANQYTEERNCNFFYVYINFAV